MKRTFVTNFGILVGSVVAATMLGNSVARADVLYRWDTGPSTERFNNSEGSEVEDNWVANAYTVVSGGTRLLSIEYPLGETFTDQPVTAIIYQGSDISDPSAGGGLVRIQTTETTITGAAGSTVTIVLNKPVDLNVGDVFYAALLLPQIPGTLFPFFNQGGTPQGHSFFDVGPTQGAPYDLDMTQNARVNGATHPVVGAGVQSPGNTFIRVNATDTP